MNNKDTEMLSEAYKQVNEGHPIAMGDTGMTKAIVQYRDETSKYPQYADIIKDGDTITIKFDNNFTLSRMSEEDAYKFSQAIADVVRDRR